MREAEYIIRAERASERLAIRIETIVADDSVPNSAKELFKNLVEDLQSKGILTQGDAERVNKFFPRESAAELIEMRL